MLVYAAPAAGYAAAAPTYASCAMSSLLQYGFVIVHVGLAMGKVADLRAVGKSVCTAQGTCSP
jgi:hypothetical protein